MNVTFGGVNNSILVDSLCCFKIERKLDSSRDEIKEMKGQNYPRLLIL